MARILTGGQVRLTVWCLLFPIRIRAYKVSCVLGGSRRVPASASSDPTLEVFNASATSKVSTNGDDEVFERILDHVDLSRRTWDGSEVRRS